MTKCVFRPKIGRHLGFWPKRYTGCQFFSLFFSKMSSVINLGPNKILVGGIPDITPIPPTPTDPNIEY